MKWLFLLLVFSVPFQTRIVIAKWTTPFNEWTAAFLWGTDILFILFLALGIFNGKMPRIRKEDWLLIGALFIAGFSISQALVPAISWYRILKLTEYILFFWYARRMFADVSIRSSVLYVLVASAFFQALIGIGQFAIQSDFGLRVLGESALNPNGQSVAVIAANSHKYIRAYGTTPHPNILATWLILGVWALWVLYVRSAVVISRRLLLFILSPILLFGLFFTFSRTAMAAWALGSILLAIVAWKRFLAPLRYIAIVTIITGVVFSVIWWPQVRARMQISSGDEAIAQRVFYNHIAGEYIRGKPLTGIGIGQFVPTLMERLPVYPEFIYQPVHNIVFLIATEIGLIGIILLGVFIGLGIWRYAILRPELVIIFGIFVFIGMFDHFFWTLQQGGLIFWGLLAFLMRDSIEITV